MVGVESSEVWHSLSSLKATDLETARLPALLVSPLLALKGQWDLLRWLEARTQCKMAAIAYCWSAD